VNEQIAANKRRTFLMLFGFVVVIVLVATAIVLLFGGGWVGIIIAFVIALALAWGSYYNSDKIAIAASRAQPADETEYRRYHHLVEGWCIAAGLP
jgi:heat shock protein HtpX